MRRLWLIGGTADARDLARRLVDLGFSVLATVATEQGERLWTQEPGLEVRMGRLSEEEMKELLSSEEFLAVVDGSHPYAVEVSAMARRAAQHCHVPLFRMGRAETPLVGDVRAFDDAAAVVEFLTSQEGREGVVFLTVGSKELQVFAAMPDAASRLVARVLPDAGVMSKCEALGLSASNVIAMMGPFSQAMNEAMLASCKARWLVTKDGGATGGVPEKYAAAAALGIPVLLVGRPAEGTPPASADEITERLLNLTASNLPEQPDKIAPLEVSFPLFVNVKERPVLVVGGGSVASRRCARLLENGASVFLVAPHICATLEEQLGSPRLRWEKREWRDSDCEGAAFVLAATDKGEVNEAVMASARRRGILVNRADRHEGNDFLFPAVIRSGGDVAALSTGGDSPLRCAALAERLREQWPTWTRRAPAGRALRVVSRESNLAVAQSRLVMELIDEVLGLKCELITVKTTGDAIQDRTLEAVGGKGLFVKELELALLEGRADLAVHSLKDMPAQLHPELIFSACLPRGDERDCLVMGPHCDGTPKRIGTSSRRRIFQAQELFPDAALMPLRGNVTSRLAKLDKGEFDALILAATGLERLGLAHRISRTLESDEMISSAGQGALVVQCRRDSWACDATTPLNHKATQQCCDAERAFVAVLEGGCTAPHGAVAYVEGETLRLEGLYVDDGNRLFRGSVEGPVDDGETMARRLALQLRKEAELS